MKVKLKDVSRTTIIVGILLIISIGVLVLSAETTSAKSNKVKVEFCNTNLYIDWQDTWFNKDNNKFNYGLAMAGLVLSQASEKNFSKCTAVIEKLKHAAAFKEPLPLHYTREDILPSRIDYPGMTFAYKKINFNGTIKYIVIAVFRGTTTSTDNDDILTDLGSQVNGFLTAGRNSKGELKNYIDKVINKKKKVATKKNTILYLVGHSYGGAVAGQVARMSSDISSKIFAYTYASPNYDTEKDDIKKYKNVFNYVHKDDVVTNVPIGYKRVGKDLPFSYFSLGKKEKNVFNKVYTKISGKNYEEEIGKNPLRIITPNNVIISLLLKNTNTCLTRHLPDTYMSFMMSGLSESKLNGYLYPTPAQVSGVKCSAPKDKYQGNKIVIKWKKASGAEKYDVCIKKANGEWSVVKTTDKTSYTYKGNYNTKYYVRIRGVNHGNKGLYPKEASYTTKKLLIAKPKITKTSVKGNAVTITWKKATNAKKYELEVYLNNSRIKKIPTKNLTYTYKGKYSTTYEFKVRGINGKTKGEYSGTKKATTGKKPKKIKYPIYLNKDQTKAKLSANCYFESITLGEDPDDIGGDFGVYINNKVIIYIKAKNKKKIIAKLMTGESEGLYSPVDIIEKYGKYYYFNGGFQGCYRYKIGDKKFKRISDEGLIVTKKTKNKRYIMVIKRNRFLMVKGWRSIGSYDMQKGKMNTLSKYDAQDSTYVDNTIYWVELKNVSEATYDETYGETYNATIVVKSADVSGKNIKVKKKKKVSNIDLDFDGPFGSVEIDRHYVRWDSNGKKNKFKYR